MDKTIYVERTDPEARQAKEPPAHVPGWGADADPANRPAVPMERTPPRISGVPALDLQPLTVEVLHSTERPGITPVFGTTVPPRGVSGAMRRAAFRYSENDLHHWFMLLAADRVNMVEGVVDDLAHGHVPSVFAEMGLASEWKYNRAAFVRKALVAGAVAGAAVWLLRRRRD